MSSFPGVVKTDDKIGRYLEASRDIKPGELIITEEALVTGPSGDPTPHKICLGCYKVITGEPVDCSICKWPMCSEKCEKIIQHAKFECKVFKNANLKPTTDPTDYLSIKVLRCLLLKEVNSKKYDQVIKLESHQKKGPKIASKEICEFIHKRCNQKAFDTGMVNQTSAIVAINSYSTSDRVSLTDAPRMASLLFFNASMMSHCCVPNTSWVRVENDDGTFSIKVWATVPIKKGEQITTQYLDVTRATIERRAHLMDLYLFSCTCPRCSDPTELGTNYSSIKCSKCPPGKGYMSSTEPLKGVDAVWQCDSCGGQQPYKECSVLVECQIVSEIQAAESEEDLEKVLESHSGVTVHPNHYLLMDARQEIVKRMYNTIATISELPKRVQNAKRMVELVKALVNVTEKFYPGKNKIKARLTYYLRYAESCTQGDGPNVEANLEKIEDIIRKGDEMLIFEE